MAAGTLGTASGRIRVDYDDNGMRRAIGDARVYRDETGRLRDEHGRFARSMDQSSDASDRFGRSLGNTRGSLQSVATASGVAAGIIAAGFVLSAKKAIEFEKQISAIGAVSSATKSELDQLRAKALQLGTDTTYSASEAAMAMEELAKAGISVKDILNGAADAAVALAAAGGISLPEAAELAADAMSSFGLAATDMVHIADLIAGAANASSIDVSQFGQSLKQVGAVAHLAGISFDDVAAAIALMGKMGIKGSDAGTSLKTMLMNLNPTSKKQIDLMRELGLMTKDGANAFFDASGKAKSLSQISDLLNKSLANLTQQQKLSALETLFGSDAIRAGAVLSQQGAAGFESMAAAMGKVKAADVAAQRLDNVAGSIEQLKGSAETLAINFGTLLLPIIRKVADFLTTLANKLNSLSPGWQQIIVYVSLAVMGFLLLMAAAAGLGLAILSIGAASGALSMAGIVAGAVAAFVALSAAIWKAWESSETFRTAVSAMARVVSEGVTQIVGKFKPLVDYVRNELLPALGGAFTTAWKRMQPAIEAVTTFFETRVQPAFRSIASALEYSMPTIVTVAKFLGTVLVEAIKLLGAWIGWIGPKILGVIGPVFSFLVTILSGAIRSIKVVADVLKTTFDFVVVAVSSIISFLAAAWAVVGPPVVAVFTLIWNIIRLVFNLITASVMVWWTFMSGIWASIFNALVLPIMTAFNAISFIISTVMGAVSGFVSKHWGTISSVFGAAMDTIWGVTQRVWGAIFSVISMYVENVVSVIRTIGRIVGMVADFFGQLRNAASGGAASLVSFVSGIPGRIFSALGNLGSLLYGSGKDLIQGLINGISSMAGAVVNKARDLANSVKESIQSALHMGSPSRDTYQYGRWVDEGFANGISDHTGKIVSAATLAAMAARDSMAKLASAAMGHVGSVNDSISSKYGYNTPGSRANTTTNSNIYNVNAPVNAPQNMSPDDVGDAVSRRVLLGLVGTGVTL